jgi:DNA-binding CsgD family transcriptional regulator
VHGQFLEMAGELAAAAAMFEEANAIATATGGVPTWDSPSWAAMGDEENLAMDKIEAAHRDAVRAGDSERTQTTERARAVLYNGLGRYGEGLASARRYCDRHRSGGTGPVLMELVEAASRCNELELAAEALQRLRVRTQNGGTDWALGVEARSRALLSQGQAADELYREAIERLRRCRMKVYLARVHLLYGEWLRRERRPKDAGEQLRRACEMFDAIGARTFGKRARAELLATGGRPPTVSHRLSVELTPQEALVARLASEKRTNQDIAAQLFLSPYTVDYHLRKVFRKLDINGRGELDRSLLDSVSASVGGAD